MLALLGRGAALTFNLTTDASTCADALQLQAVGAATLLPAYHPLPGQYNRDNCTLSRAEVAFSAVDFLFLQRMGGANVTSRRLRRKPGDADFPAVSHVLLPYNCVGAQTRVVFVVPFVETPGAGCFPWPGLLARANNTADGLLTFWPARKAPLYYYLASVTSCGQAEIAAVLGGATGTADLSALPATLVPLNTNCATEGVDAAQTFLNGVGWNFCFWLLFCTLLFLGGYTVVAESEVPPDPAQKDNWRTHYPPYSLHCAASAHYPKHARMVQLVVAWAAVVFFQAALERAYPSANVALRVLLLPLLSALFALPFGLLTGWLLGRAYATNRAFVAALRRAESVDERLRAEEGWERRQYRAYFLFYVAGALLIGALLLGGVVLLEGLDRTAQGWWMLGLALGAGWVLLVQEPLLALLAKASPAADRLLRRRGYWFDYDTAAQIEAQHLQ